MASEDGQPQGSAALQSFFDAVTPTDGQKPSQQALEALATRMNDLMPANANDHSELVNEDGLPIIEVTEPRELADARTPTTAVLADEHPITPLSSLTPEERRQRNIERDRILDLLEQEEEETLRRERQEFVDIHKANALKRQEDARKETERLKAKKEMQKKMGKALMRQMAEARDRDETARKEEEARDLLSEQARRDDSHKPKKKVSFVGLPEEAESPSGGGGLSKGKLRSPQLKKSSDSQSFTMKSTVVERTPKTLLQQGSAIGDSDDESNPPTPSTSSDDDDEEETDVELEEDGYDFDEAVHQREVAAEYYKQKAAIGTSAQAAMSSHPHDELYNPEDPDPFIRPPAKPSISRFKAEKIASAYGPSEPSTSLGPSVVPVSSTRTLQKAIRTGKLDSSGRLVDGAGDESSEEEKEGVQEVLELLTKGKIQNVGPNPENVPPANTSAMMPSVESLPVLPGKSKTSKFKLSREGFNRADLVTPPPIPSVVSSQSATPVSSVGRSSPKIAEPPLSNTPTPSSSSIPIQPFSMVIDSPSFPSPNALGKSSPISTPSSSQAATSRRPDRPPTIMSTSVMERQPGGDSSSPSPGESASPPKRVSRFKAERG